MLRSWQKYTYPELSSIYPLKSKPGHAKTGKRGPTSALSLQWLREGWSCIASGFYHRCNASRKTRRPWTAAQPLAQTCCISSVGHPPGSCTTKRSARRRPRGVRWASQVNGIFRIVSGRTQRPSGFWGSLKVSQPPNTPGPEGRPIISSMRG